MNINSSVKCTSLETSQNAFFFYQHVLLLSRNKDPCLKLVFFEIFSKVYMKIIFPEVGQKNEEEKIETDPLGLLI